jgi:hypothetical protein
MGLESYLFRVKFAKPVDADDLHKKERFKYLKIQFELK